MNSKKNAVWGMITRTTLSVIAVALFCVANSQQAQAQLVPPPPAPLPPVTLNYSFSVPMAKVVPNPCTSGFTLVTGSTNFTIQSTDSTTGFNLKIDSNSSGKGEDASADGTLITNGTQKPQYDYSSTTTSEGIFPVKPTDVLQTLTVGEYLVRPVDSADSFIMKTVFEITYANGVPAVPVLRSIDARCTK